jgi:hypothetical protein
MTPRSLDDDAPRPRRSRIELWRAPGYLQPQELDQLGEKPTDQRSTQSAINQDSTHD